MTRHDKAHKGNCRLWKRYFIYIDDISKHLPIESSLDDDLEDETESGRDSNLPAPDGRPRSARRYRPASGLLHPAVEQVEQGPIAWCPDGVRTLEWLQPQRTQLCSPMVPWYLPKMVPPVWTYDSIDLFWFPCAKSTDRVQQGHQASAGGSVVGMGSDSKRWLGGPWNDPGHHAVPQVALRGVP